MKTDSITAAVADSAIGWSPPDPARSLDVDPVDRMLLTADGTVTTLLEACTGEPIVTRTTRQSGPAPLERVLAAAGRWWHPDAQLLELAPAERVVARRVTLRGACSDGAYVLAESLVAPDRLPGVSAECLLRVGASLGACSPVASWRPAERSSTSPPYERERPATTSISDPVQPWPAARTRS